MILIIIQKFDLIYTTRETYQNLLTTDNFYHQTTKIKSEKMYEILDLQKLKFQIENHLEILISSLLLQSNFLLIGN